MRKTKILYIIQHSESGDKDTLYYKFIQYGQKNKNVGV